MLKPKAHALLGTKRRRLIAIGLRSQTLIGLLLVVALALPMHAAAAAQVPLKAAETGTFQLLGPCETGGIVVDVAGSGHATHLGDFTTHYRECFVRATGAVTDGSFTLTAANGDTIFGTYGGQVSPTADSTVFAYKDPGTITGGTGRFAGASGTVDTSGVVNLATGEYSGTIAGSLSSLASP
jgi:hypothetical protein